MTTATLPPTPTPEAILDHQVPDELKARLSTLDDPVVAPPRAQRTWTPVILGVLVLAAISAVGYWGWQRYNSPEGPPKNLESQARFLDGSSRPIQLRRGSDEHAELVRQHTGLCAFCNPAADGPGLLTFALERANRRWRAIEHRDRIAPVFAVAVHIGHERAEQAVSLRADLVGGAVIDA